MRKIAGLLLILAVLVGTSPGTYAFIMPQVTQVATLDELLAWYDNGGGACLLTAEVEVDRPIVLNKEQMADIAVVVAPIRVAAGGRLTIDGAGTNLQGPGALVTVEAGGELHLLNGAAYSGLTENVFFLAEGAVYERGEDFFLSWDVPAPEPPEEVIPAPITDLWGEVRKVKDGMLTYSMTLPRLEMEEVAAIHIERSADGERWEWCETFFWDEDRGYFSSQTGGFSAVNFGVKSTYITYVEETDYLDFYLRVELEGTPYAGVSNAVKVEIPAGARPDEVVKPPTTGDYEDIDGNRGGGGQGGREESDRVEQQEPEPTPEPEASSTPSPEAVPSPSQPPAEPTIPPVEEPTSTPEPTASQPVRDVVAVTKPKPNPAPNPSPSPAPEATVAPAPSAAPAISPVEGPTTTPEPTPAPEPTQISAPEKPEAKGSGDMLWLAGGLTLVLVGGGAAILFLKRKP